MTQKLGKWLILPDTDAKELFKKQKSGLIKKTKSEYCQFASEHVFKDSVKEETLHNSFWQTFN